MVVASGSDYPGFQVGVNDFIGVHVVRVLCVALSPGVLINLEEGISRVDDDLFRHRSAINFVGVSSLVVDVVSEKVISFIVSLLLAGDGCSLHPGSPHLLGVPTTGDSPGEESLHFSHTESTARHIVTIMVAITATIIVSISVPLSESNSEQH